MADRGEKKKGREGSLGGAPFLPLISSHSLSLSLLLCLSPLSAPFSGAELAKSYNAREVWVDSRASFTLCPE